MYCVTVTVPRYTTERDEKASSTDNRLCDTSECRKDDHDDDDDDDNVHDNDDDDNNNNNKVVMTSQLLLFLHGLQDFEM
jgi:TATA-binding protein-associated factor Taf7